MTIANEVVEVEASCWECGYSLRGLSSRRCPECGRPFDPADPPTLNTGHVVGPLTRWLMSPPGWPMYLLLAGAVLISLWACIEPKRVGAFSDILGQLLLTRPPYWGYRLRGLWGDFDRPEGRFLLGAVFWTILAIAWIARRVARGTTVRQVSRQKPAPFAYWRRWLLVPVIFGATVLVCMTRLPTYAAFWFSKPALERAALDARVNGSTRPHTIGLFGYPSPRARGWEVVPVEYDGAGKVAVHIAWDFDLVRHDDGRAPPLPPRNRATRLSANWFLVEPDRISN